MKNQVRSSLLLLSAFVSPLANATSLQIGPIADAYVASGPSGTLANNNYGGGGALAVSASVLRKGEFQSVLKFDLSVARDSFNTQYGEGQWSVGAVSLVLSASPHSNALYNEVAPGVFAISLMQNSSWAEGSGNASAPGTGGITFNTLQSTYTSASDQPLGTYRFEGATGGAREYALPLSAGLVSDLISGDMASFRLSAADNNVSYLFTSRSGALESQPQLVMSAIPEPGIVPLFAVGLAGFFFRSSNTVRRRK